MSDRDEIVRELQRAGIDASNEHDIDAVERLTGAALFSLPVAAEVVATGRPPEPRRRRGPLRRLLDALADEQHARERYLQGSPEVRDAYLAGHAAGLRDALMFRP